MDPKDYKSFSSKILLFGEYLVLGGGETLSFPYAEFSLRRSSSYHIKNKYYFEKFLAYLQQNERLKRRLQPRFASEVARGLHFDSNIPVGYGLGSSGALVAAIYHEFFDNKPTDYLEIKNDLAELESFFHEKSSGIDPLTSYVNQPILSRSGDIRLAEKSDLGSFVLFDSGIRRSAKDAISHFQKLQKSMDGDTFKSVLSELTLLSNLMIGKWQRNEPIHDEMRAYSALQLLYFIDFIPAAVQREWKAGLDSHAYYMKLCGAGMGGMYLKWLG